MAYDITTAQKVAYQQGMEHALQQKKSKLEATVKVVEQVGKETAVDRVGTAKPVKKTTRYPNTPIMPTAFNRRWIMSDTWQWGDLCDDDDKLKLIHDPTSDLAQAGQMGMQRTKDDVIIEAAWATVPAGEKSTDGSVAFPAGQIIPLAEGGTDTGLTFGKINLAREMLSEAQVPEEDPRYWVCTEQQISNLMNEDKATNADYVTIGAIQNGKFEGTYTVLAPGRVYLSASVANVFGLGGAVKFQVLGTSYNTTAMAQAQYSADNVGPYHVFAKSRGGATGDYAAVHAGDLLGALQWRGADGTSTQAAAQIAAFAEGSVAAGAVPARLIVYAADAAGVLVERMRFWSGGLTTIGGQPSGEVLRCNSVTAPNRYIEAYNSNGANPGFTTNGGDLELSSATGQVKVVGNILASRVRTDPVLFAALPTAASAGKGARAYITDSTTGTYGAVVAGGGGTETPVWSNGANWLAG